MYTASDVEVTVDGKVQKSVDKDYIVRCRFHDDHDCPIAGSRSGTKRYDHVAPNYLNSGDVLLGSLYKGLLLTKVEKTCMTNMSTKCHFVERPHGPVTGTITLAPPATKMPISAVVKAAIK